jgi:DNA-binding HxlR family transcriptional regulator
MYDYREYCPIAKASQLLGERWTLLIIRELLLGSTRFNQLRRYLPRLSPTLLKARLRTLEDEGIVARVRVPEEPNRYEYTLTAAGRDLEPVVVALGTWATEWQFDKFKNDEIHIDALMRDLEYTLVPAEMPGSRTVLRFLLSVNEAIEPWFIEIENERIESCDEDRGFDVDVYLSTAPRTIADILLGKSTLGEVTRDGRLKLTGSRAHIACIDRWFGLAPYKR